MSKPPSLPLNRSLLTMGERVAVAVSGGADSTALLLALREASGTLGMGLSAVHVHHGLRGHGADQDEAFVRQICLRLDLPLHVRRVDVPAAAAADGETLEEAARHARLRVFSEIMAEGNLQAVATAHTEDDQAETVMLKLIRGAWTEGLGGISPTLPIAGGRVIRPLLGTSRAEVLQYLQARGETWQEDETNASPEHTRNRVRHTLMPLLREFNPRIAETLAQTADLAREEEAHWTGEVARLLGAMALPGRPVRGGGRAVGTSAQEQTIAIEIERLRGLDLPTRRRVIRAAAVKTGARLTASETRRILQMCTLAPVGAPLDPTVPTKANSRLPLSNGLRAERSVRELRLTRTSLEE